MIRVLYLEHNIDGTVGGSHYCLLEICRGIRHDQYQPVVCFFQENSLLDEFKATGAEVIIRSSMKPVQFQVTHFRRLAAVLQAGINAFRALVIRTVQWIVFLKRQNIGLVHINNACGYDHDLILAAWILRIPCVVHERGIQPSLPPATHFFAKRVHKIIAISNVVKQNLIDKGIEQNRIIRIDDGIDPDRLSQLTPVEQLKQQWKVPDVAPVIGIVGNIKYWKGQETVIRAVTLLTDRFPELRCFIVGTVYDRPYKEKLDALVHEHRLESRIIFTGYQKRPTDLMAIFDICVHASVEPEPFGIVLLEAMGKSKPVIATNIGGPLEILIDGRTGYLVKPGDAPELAEKIGLLLSNRERMLEMGRFGSKRVQEQYTISYNIDKLQHLYAEALAH